VEFITNNVGDSIAVHLRAELLNRIQADDHLAR
jgi:hypothetical protein